MGVPASNSPEFAVIDLNKVVRPFTAKWHRKSQKGAFNSPE